jgi:hypothetical protein
MPQVIYAEPGDEIVDLVDRVRTSADSEVALVLGAGARAMQTPLNVRLLRQLGTRAGKTVSIISGDPHIQELSRVGGLPTYASVPAFERGIQTVRPHGDDAYPGSDTMVPAASPPLAPPAPPRAVAGAPVLAGATTTVTTRRGTGRRRPLYFAAAGVLVLGIILLVVVAPSAKVTITLAGTPLTVNPTIQGSPDPANAGQADHIVTSVVTSDQQAQFTATPTGQQQVPASKANATIVFSTDLPNGAQFQVPQGEEFDTQDNPPIRFYATQSTHICIGATCTAPNNSVPVADGTAEAKGNVGPNTITKWPGNPCATATSVCTQSDLTETNPAAASGGADAKTNTVASTDDVSKWNAQVTQSEQTLTTQAKQDMQGKAAGKTFALDPGGNGTTVACDVTPPLPAANAVAATAQETVACHGKAAVYNAADITSDVKADLQQQVVQGDSLATDLNCTKPSVTQAADDGTVVLSLQCTSFSRTAVDLTALKGQITGKSAGDARSIIEHRLNHVQSVSISQSPLPLFWLPFFASRIEIDESFVSQAASGS